MLSQPIGRRAFLKGVAATTAALPLVGLRWPAWARASDGGPPCQWGVFSGGGLSTETLESEVGRRFVAGRLNQSMDKPIPSPFDDHNYDDGRTWEYRNCNAQAKVNGHKVSIQWADIAGGAYDAYYNTAASKIISNGRWTPANPYYFSFHHEQATNTKQQPGGTACGTPADYRNAYRHIRSLWDAAGITAGGSGPNAGTVQFCFVPYFTQYLGKKPGWAPADLDPGTDAYEVLGVDFYAHVKNGLLNYPHPAAVLDVVNDYALDVGKPFLIGECGCQDGTTQATHQNKAQWYLDLLDTLKSYVPTGGRTGDPGTCVSLLWTNVPSARPDSSSQALAAFTTLANDPFFGPPPAT